MTHLHASGAFCFCFGLVLGVSLGLGFGLRLGLGFGRWASVAMQVGGVGIVARFRPRFFTAFSGT